MVHCQSHYLICFICGFVHVGQVLVRNMDVGHLDGALSNLVPSDVGRWVSDARNLMRQLLQVWALEGVEPRAATIVHHQKRHRQSVVTTVERKALVKQLFFFSKQSFCCGLVSSLVHRMLCFMDCCKLFGSGSFFRVAVLVDPLTQLQGFLCSESLVSMHRAMRPIWKLLLGSSGTTCRFVDFFQPRPKKHGVPYFPLIILVGWYCRDRDPYNGFL